MKSLLREQMKNKRKELSINEIDNFSGEIQNFLYSLSEYKNAKTVMIYLSAFKEPSTMSIIEKMISENKKVVVPVTHVDTRSLELSYINDVDSLITGAYNILEPKNIIAADKNDIDLVIIPGIAFDKKGNRIGFGMGYYDKLLEKTKAIKIAFSYSFQVVPKIESDVYDIPMDMIITENEVIVCGAQ